MHKNYSLDLKNCPQWGIAMAFVTEYRQGLTIKIIFHGVTTSHHGPKHAQELEIKTFTFFNVAIEIEYQ
jgi:hypothetical protein